MENNILNSSAIDNQIKQIKKSIDKERKLYWKHLSKVSSFRNELYSLLELRKNLFPCQYTKCGKLRKSYKDKV